jgi:hypothetical protein
VGEKGLLGAAGWQWSEESKKEEGTCRLSALGSAANCRNSGVGSADFGSLSKDWHACSRNSLAGDAAEERDDADPDPLPRSTR